MGYQGSVNNSGRNVMDDFPFVKTTPEWRVQGVGRDSLCGDVETGDSVVILPGQGGPTYLQLIEY